MTPLPDNHFARAFLPAGKIISLPNWTHQRVLLPAERLVSRWQKSQIYPAFRISAKLYRFFTRTRSSLGLTQARENPTSAWLLGDFLRDVPLEADSAVVVVGTPGPAQKLTVQLWNNSKIVAYLKYAEKPAAKARLENEHRLLLTLPDGLGPKVLKYGELLSGKALLITPIHGCPLPARLPPSEKLWLFSESLKAPLTLAVDEHPWLQYVQERYGDKLSPWIEKLRFKRWPVVLHHGDLTPWNVLKSPQSKLQAIDWEYGDPKGFPYLDASYFILQTAALVKRWASKDAKRFAVNYLQQNTCGRLTYAESEALVNLTAHHVFQQAAVDGHPVDAPIQRWRQMVWEAKG